MPFLGKEVFSGPFPGIWPLLFVQPVMCNVSVGSVGSCGLDSPALLLPSSSGKLSRPLQYVLQTLLFKVIPKGIGN